MEFKNMYCSGTVNEGDKGTFIDVDVRINERVPNGIIRYLAASPPDFMTNFTGSGLPFPNEHISFERTPNQGSVKVDPSSASPKVTIRILTPNAYYTSFDTFVDSCIDIFFNSRKIRIFLKDATPPFRSLHHSFKSPASKDVKTQEGIIRTLAYPKL
jgi:hypothetical protein